MRLQQPRRVYQCAAIVQPGEYTIDLWDDKQCDEKNPRLLIRCEYCGKYFCLFLHWGKHLDEEAEKDTAL